MIPTSQNHRIQGGGYFYAPDGQPLRFESIAKNRGHIDGTLTISDEEAIAATRDMARLEGIFGGFSAGANAAAAVKYMKEQDSHNTAVAILICDSGLKYLSTDLYEQ